MSHDKQTYVLSGFVTLNFFTHMYCKLRILNFSYFCFQSAPNAAEGGDGGDICWHRRRRPFAKIRQKLDSQKLVKLTDHSYACNSLTNFE